MHDIGNPPAERGNTCRIEIAYCLPTQQYCESLNVEPGCTAGQAMEMARLRDEFRWLPKQTDTLKMGIFGRQCSADTPLLPGDRIEIYRPLLLSPTEARRLRARTLKQTG